MKKMLTIIVLLLLAGNVTSAPKWVDQKNNKHQTGKYVSVDALVEGLKIITSSRVILALRLDNDSAIATSELNGTGALKKAFFIVGKAVRVKGHLCVFNGKRYIKLKNSHSISLLNCNCLKGDPNVTEYDPTPLRSEQQARLDTIMHHQSDPNNPGIPLNEVTAYVGHKVLVNATISDYLTTSSSNTDLYLGDARSREPLHVILSGTELNRHTNSWWWHKHKWQFRGPVVTIGSDGTAILITSKSQIGWDNHPLSLLSR